jgi:hypothetical protein
MNKLNTVVVFIFSIAILSTNIGAHLQLRDMRADLQVAYKAPRAALPPEIMRLVAGEFKGLWANYMLLEVGSFEGSQQARTEEDFRSIYRGLKQSLVLDPYFQQTYLLAQGILPWAGKMPQEANEILDVARRHRTWDWRPGHYMGFNYYYFLNDYAKAAEVFLESAQIPDAPVLLAVLGARFAQRAEQIPAAIDLLAGMVQDENLPDYHRVELVNRLVALKGVLQLESTVTRYREIHGVLPMALETLVAVGLLSELPENPYGDTFFYDSKTGRVAFDTVK